MQVRQCVDVLESCSGSSNGLAGTLVSANAGTGRCIHALTELQFTTPFRLQTQARYLHEPRSAACRRWALWGRATTTRRFR